MSTSNGAASPRIAILGAGASGLCTAIQLKRSGFDNFVIYEKTDGVAGTWHDNTYPGAACDVPSHFYSFSFEPKSDWSRKYSGQPEIKAYFEHCASKYGLYPRIRFNTELKSARFDEATGQWRLKTAAGDEEAFDVFINGCGQLNRPYTPEIPGRDSFQGRTFHSARWDHGYDLAGKRVAVIGNGASAIQFVPKIAPIVADMCIFQRSPNWIVPRGDYAYSDFAKRVFGALPPVQTLYRWFFYWQLEKNFFAFRPGTRMAKAFEQAARQHLEANIRDPELRRILTPDYPIGCKRILIDDEFYPALARPNVHVVTAAIDRIAADGIVTADGTHRPFDAIIYATGFDTTHFLAPMEIVGLGGKSLTEAWKEGAEAYLGITMAGFPNLFMLYGPNTNLGHNSIIFMIECQVRYILKCVQALAGQHLRYLDVKRAEMERYNATVQAELARSVWAAGCDSWYKTESGKVTNNWSNFTVKYWLDTRAPDLSKFVLAH